MSTDHNSEGGDDEKSLGEHDWNELFANAIKLGKMAFVKALLYPFIPFMTL